VNKEELFVKNFTEAGGELFYSLDEVLSELKECIFAIGRGLKRKLKKFALKEASPEEADASITKVAAACAETGSLIFVFNKEKEHKLTSLPKVHVVLLKKDQIFTSLHEALSNVEGAYISVVTGPSKTGDIELIHVFGVHGPERLICVLEER
jgi:L-lactate utilization protein LutC